MEGEAPTHAEQFQHVMVLISIIVGVGITSLLTATAQVLERAAEHARQLRHSLIYFSWALQIFLWMAFFWWYQFALIHKLDWTLQRYLLSIGYAVVLFLLSAILIPRFRGDVQDADGHFMAQRRWFFGAYALATLVDIAETVSNGGWDHLLHSGWILNLGTIGVLPMVVIGCRSPNRAVQLTLSLVSLAWALATFFDILPALVRATPG